MKPAARIIRWAIGYGGLLAFFVTFANEAEATGAMLGAGLLAAIYAALADVRLAKRLPVFLGLMAALATSFVLMFRGPAPSPSSYAALNGLIVGLLAPLRVYVGTIGLPRESQARKPTLLALFGLTLYFAVVASLLATEDAAGEIAIGATLMAAACASSVLMLLGQSQKLRLAGIVLALSVLATSVVAVVLTTPGRSLAAMMLAEVLLTPFAAAAVLRFHGYRLRR